VIGYAPPLPGSTFAEAGVLTIWSPLIFEQIPAGGASVLIGGRFDERRSSAGLDDLITETSWQPRTSLALDSNRDGKRSTLWEDFMASDFASTFLACGGIFLLSFFMIWAFWFVERLRGASAPQLGK
jgi:hypothetical protein